jgi:hypothetical protein
MQEEQAINSAKVEVRTTLFYANDFSTAYSAFMMMNVHVVCW